MKVYLISPKTLKQKSLVNDNTLDKFIVPAIDAAQNINLKQIIGKFLLDKLLMLCSTEDEQHVKLIEKTEYTAYKYLLQNYITDYLCYSVMDEIQIPVHQKVRNAGTIQNTDENYIQSSLQELNYIRGFYRDKAEFIGNSLQKWILKNRTDYPEFFTQGCGLNSKQESYNCGVVLD